MQPRGVQAVVRAILEGGTGEEKEEKEEGEEEEEGRLRAPIHEALISCHLHSWTPVSSLFGVQDTVGCLN